MVPGMAERERLAADARRADWYSAAASGPALPQGSYLRFDPTPRPDPVLTGPMQLLWLSICRLMTDASQCQSRGPCPGPLRPEDTRPGRTGRGCIRTPFSPLRGEKGWG
jgi:hypothetical protein